MGGARHQRSTNDHLVRLETFIREAFIKMEHLVAVFFELERSNDTTWKYGIMNNLHEIGLKADYKCLFRTSHLIQKSN